MVTSRSYYKGLINIPNVDDVAPNSALLGNATELDLFINEYERDYLVKALGFSLFKDLSQYFSPWLKEYRAIKTAAPERWKDLVNGKEYTYNGVDYHWRGLVFDDCGEKKSPLAYYVYYYFLESDLNRYMGTGIVKEQPKNAVIADPAPKAVQAWRKFYQMTVKSPSDEVALYQFLEHQNCINGTYKGWRPYQFGRRNIMGI